MWWDGMVFDANLLLKFNKGQGSLAGVGDLSLKGPTPEKKAS